MNIHLAPGAGDRVSIVTFDALDAYHAPKIVVSLTANFDAATTAALAVTLAAGPHRDFYRLERAVCRARAGGPEQAVAEVEEVLMKGHKLSTVS